MIQISNSTEQTIAPGQAATFDTIMLHTGCSECFNVQIPNSIKLKGGCYGIYEIQFSGNVSTDTALTAGQQLQLAIGVAGFPLVGTQMDAVPAAVDTNVNVSTSTFFQAKCSDQDRVSIVNNGTLPVVLAANSIFKIARKS